MFYSYRTSFRALDDVYRATRAAMEQQWSELEKLDTKEKEIRKDHGLTAQGKQERLAAIEEKRKICEKSLSVFRADAVRRLEVARDEALKAPSKWQINGRHIDKNVQALIDSGILTDSELIALAAEPQNLTMARIYAKELHKRAERAEQLHKPDEERARLEYAAIALDELRNPVEALFSSYSVIFDNALRTDQLYADGTAAMYPETFAESLQTAENLDNENRDHTEQLYPPTT